MENLVDITQSIIDKIDLDIKISSVVANRVNVCGSTLFLTIDKVVVIESLNYTITDFILNEWIEVIPKGHTTDVPVDATIVTAPEITLLQGTPISVNNEYKQLNLRTSAKTPFIWLVEPYSFNDQAIESSIDVEFKAKLLFLDWADSEEWLNKQHNDRVIKPMSNLKDAFIDVINEDYNFKRLESTTSLTRPRFGVYQTNKGATKHILDETLSGVEFDMDLKVYDMEQCNCDINTIPLPTYVTVQNSNLSYNVTVTNGGTLPLPNIDFTDSTGITTNVPSMDDLVCTPSSPKSGIAYVLPQNSQTISYSQFDAGWHTANTPTPANPTNPLYYATLDYTAGNGLDTLVDDNLFGGGNKNRFTDELGTQVYANNYRIDHLHRIGWYEVVQTGLDWYGHIINANNLVHLGFSNYRLPNMEEVGSSYSFDSRFIVGVSTHNRFTSNTRLGFSSIAIMGNYLTYASGVNKTAASTNSYYCRWHV